MADKAEKNNEEVRIKDFEAVVAEYEGPLLRYTMRLLGNNDAAQDVVQDTFIRLYRTWKDEMKPSSKLATWLYRVAHNCAVDTMRKLRRRELLHLKHAEEKGEEVEMPKLTSTPEISEAAEKAARALKQLSIREQQLVILKIYEGKSYEEISEITGLTKGNVGYILHFAMKKMAEAIKNDRI